MQRVRSCCCSTRTPRARTTSVATTTRARCDAIAQLACRLADAPEELIEVVDPPAGPAPTLGRLDLAGLHELGWKPAVELEDGMRRTLEWLSSPA